MAQRTHESPPTAILHGLGSNENRPTSPCTARGWPTIQAALTTHTTSLGRSSRMAEWASSRRFLQGTRDTNCHYRCQIFRGHDTASPDASIVDLLVPCRRRRLKSPTRPGSRVGHPRTRWGWKPNPRGSGAAGPFAAARRDGLPRPRALPADHLRPRRGRGDGPWPAIMGRQRPDHRRMGPSD